MLRPAIDLGADMTAYEVLQRLALNGFWASAQHPAARARIDALSARLNRPADAVAAMLARDARGHGAAIRRQWGTHILWYALDLQEVLDRCAFAPPDQRLLDVLGLHERDSEPAIELHASDGTALATGVVMDRGRPVAVNLGGAQARAEPGAPLSRGGGDSVPISRPAPSAAPNVMTMDATPPLARAQAWPRVDAPDCVPAAQPFDVVVGFSVERQAGVAGGPVVLPVKAGARTIDVDIELAAGQGVQAQDGWRRTLSVPVDDLAAAQVSFRLIGTEPIDADQPWLTMLEVRYVVAGTVCGTAARPLSIVASGSAVAPQNLLYGAAWQATPAAASPVLLAADEHAPDLTIEISKPDRNASSGRYACQIYSPHALGTVRGPFEMELGQDAKTFARSMVEEIRLFSASELLESTIESMGRLVAERLPSQVFDALREVALVVAPAVPAVLIVSAEPYVPWELAWMEPPLDPARPCHLGAQALVGRWLRDDVAPASPQATAAGIVLRPATHPIAELDVQNMAVMVAWYQAQSGLRRLLKAEDEGKALAQQYEGVALAASAPSLRQLLNASVERGFERVSVQAVHFAGHGDFDPSRPDGSALFLMDGTPLRSTLFRAAKYGGDHQPLMFLNACMLGIGGELLGDMAGFPGNALRGGFGGVLGALWEVDDAVAHDVALEFWQRALPAAPARGEPLGAILRDLRAKYIPGALPAPIATYLAYVYYGHPRLTLARVSAP